MLRRLYLYLMAAAGLAVLVFGLSQLGDAILPFVVHGPGATPSRSDVALFASMTVVSLAVWGVHVALALHLGRTDPAEQASAIRRLYVYFACLMLVLVAATTLYAGLGNVLTAVVDRQSFDALGTSQYLWTAAVALGFWVAHLRLAAVDRAKVSETGASATLRRWYFYPALLLGLLVFLDGVDGILQVGALRILAPGLPSAELPFLGLFGEALSALIVGGGVWVTHALLVRRPSVREADRTSAVRATEGFLVAFIVIWVALASAQQILQELFGLGLGIAQVGPGASKLELALLPPAASVLVYGLAWFFMNRRLDRDAAAGEVARRAGIRRLSTNLLLLVGLGAFAAGCGGVLWIAGQQLEGLLLGIASPGWKEPLSGWLSLLIVGGILWGVRWRQNPAPDERQALSRRLYLYVALFGSVLALLAGGVGVVNAILHLLLSQHPRLTDPENLDFGRFFAVVVVSAVAGGYHAWVLRREVLARGQAGATAVPGSAVDAAAPRYRLEVVGLDERQLLRMLAQMPPSVAHTTSEIGPSSGVASGPGLDQVTGILPGHESPPRTT